MGRNKYDLMIGSKACDCRSEWRSAEPDTCEVQWGFNAIFILYPEHTILYNLSTRRIAKWKCDERRHNGDEGVDGYGKVDTRR